MSDLVQFFGALLPAFYDLAISMYHAYEGSVPRAQADITDRKSQIDALRKARDVDLRRKYPE